MSYNYIDAKDIVCQPPVERELIDVTLNVDFIDVIPVYPYTDNTSNFIKQPILPMSKLDYRSISKVTNDFVEQFTINPNIKSIKVAITLPEEESEKAKESFKECLVDCKRTINIDGNEINIDNNALKEDNVTKLFKIGISENIYLQTSKPPKVKQKKQNKEREIPLEPMKKTDNKVNLSQDDIDFIQTLKDPLRVYFEDTLNNSSTMYDAVSNFSEIATDTNSDIKLGSNGKLYYNEMEKGNQYYKITGKLSNVAKMGSNIGSLAQLGSFIMGLPNFQKDLDSANTVEQVLSISGEKTGELIGGLAGGSIGAKIGNWMGCIVVVGLAVSGVVVSTPVVLVIVGGTTVIGGIVGAMSGGELGKNIGKTMGGFTGKEIDENPDLIERALEIIPSNKI